MRAGVLGILVGAVLSFAAVYSQSAPGRSIKDVRFWTLGDSTRVVIETSNEFEYKSDRVPDPDRVFFDFHDTTVRIGPKRHTAIPVNDGRLKQIRVAETSPGMARVVFDLEPNVDFAASTLQNPSRLIVELRRAASAEPAGKVISSAPPAPEPSSAPSQTPPVDATLKG